MKKFALKTLRFEKSPAFVATILGFVFLAGAFLKASTPSKLYPVFLFDGIPQNAWSGVVSGVIIFELILGTMLITAFYLEKTLRLSVLVLTIFTAQLLVLLFAAQPVSCGCFGDISTLGLSVKGSLLLGVARNIFMILAAMFSITQPRV
jgi:hypothetical protein